MNPNRAATRSFVDSGLAGYSNTMAGPHELFDDTGLLKKAVNEHRLKPVAPVRQLSQYFASLHRCRRGFVVPQRRGIRESINAHWNPHLDFGAFSRR